MAPPPLLPCRSPAPVLHSEDFAHWLTTRSFTMLIPLCRVGLVVVLAMLIVVDPLLLHSGVWGAHPQHVWLVVWHAAAAVHFLAFPFAARRAQDHRHRSRVLECFFILNAALFCWFGLISWMLSGDLSTYAMFLLTMVCVFAYPGPFRRLVNIASALCLTLLIWGTDPRGIFHTSGAALNLLALHVVALLIDRYLMGLNLALYQEKCLVEHERARADQVLYNALPVSIANELKNHNTVKAEQYQRMAVLFVDIAGFTRFSAGRPPDGVVQVLNEIFSGFDTLVDRYDAEKIKTIGDAYMVVGKGNVSDIARLALDMVASMQAYSRQIGFPLAVRCGMHVGPTVAGVIGLKRFLYDVWGDAVNTASRMESLGQAGRVHVSEEVYRELSSDFAFECRGPMEVKGKGVLRTYFLLHPLPDSAPLIRPSAATTSAGAS